ncbi:Thymidine kinase, cytosolic [Chamberlinius hualienensis]
METDNCSGSIQLILGPMFSGKTTELIRRLKRYQIARHKCLVIKYANDIRYNNESLSTHDKQFYSAVSVMTLCPVFKDALEFSVIGIDEGQFFPDTVEFCERMANCGKTVIVAALDGTYQRLPFGSILNLIPLSETVIKLTAVCMKCFKSASYTKRISNETQVEVIGGADKYIAVCRSCYLSNDEDEKKSTASHFTGIVDKTPSPTTHCF